MSTGGHEPPFALWFLGLVLLAASGTQAAGFVGCLYEDVCLESEYCLNDHAFGQCVGSLEDETEMELAELTRDQLFDLSDLAESLLFQGHQWQHIYTQCVLQTRLLTLRTRVLHDPSVCELVNDIPGLPPGSRAVPAIPPDYQLMDGDDVTVSRDDVVRAVDVNDGVLSPYDYEQEEIALGPDAGEMPFPDLYRQQYDVPYQPDIVQKPGLVIPQITAGDSAADESRSGGALEAMEELAAGRQPLIMKRSLAPPTEDRIDVLRHLLNDVEEHLENKEGDDDLATQLRDSAPLEEVAAEPEERTRRQLSLQDSPLRSDELLLLPQFRDVPEDDSFKFEDRFLSQYQDQQTEKTQNSNGNFLNRYQGPQEAIQLEDRLTSHYQDQEDSMIEPSLEDRFMSQYQQQEMDDIEPRDQFQSSYDERMSLPQEYQVIPEEQDFQDAVVVAEEEGWPGLRQVVEADFLPQSDSEDLVEASEDLDFLDSLDETDGFRRAERLDTKKPGPWFGINNYAFDYEFDGQAPPARQTRVKVPGYDSFPIPFLPITPLRRIVETGTRSNDVMSEDAGVLSGDVLSDISVAGDASDTETSSDREVIKVAPADTQTAVNAKFFKAFQREDEGKTLVVKTLQKVNGTERARLLVTTLESLLNLPENTFSNVQLAGHEVKFHVSPNQPTLDVATAAEAIGDVRDIVYRKLGIDIISATEYHQQKAASGIGVRAATHTRAVLFPLAMALSSLFAVILVVLLTVFFCKRHRVKSVDGPEAASKSDTEASHHYQELCRSRMASKKAEKAENSPLKEKPNRVHSVSRESDGSMPSPTSRSSTSSWSEEPVVSNMDISTGHMVLSYMEDHLKKKDKLDKEWSSLCAYEAEPSSCTMAELPANQPKNRRQEALPYDHSRVVLNPVTNANGSDYVNASTITDHDPRNPAYIATQGVMPQTVNDFWQMVWEQGSVVIVMLTRLTENGVVMCHRYWPEEGSELYHIYEVHLVSEHIWCDEYLVRSFYLKNLKTSETRTVTQFHFLAWPDQGVPASTKALLEFRRKVNKSYRGRSCPVIVHCSDGAGRTGTYCLIDMVLNRMAKGAKEIDIAATLEHIRDQRADVVRTRPQFEFVLMAVAEEVHAIIKALPQ